MSLRPLAEWPMAQRRGLRGILTDIDDTFTSHGSLQPAALEAVVRAKAAGLLVIAVTGRPSYWTLPLLRLCRFDAVIAENGASAYWMDAGGMQQAMYYAEENERRLHRQKLEAFAQLLCSRFPDMQVAQDAPLRIGDLAFDIGENRVPLDSERVEQLVALIRSQGLHATTSSIHAHAAAAVFSKQSMSQRVLQEVFGIQDEEARQTFAFIGDSANDASMFAHYPISVGVANITRFLDRFTAHPAYIAQGECADGFIEMIETVLAAKE
jgi:HAD superfamily hydrolase (TIGR01484 family)